MLNCYLWKILGCDASSQVEIQQSWESQHFSVDLNLESKFFWLLGQPNRQLPPALPSPRLPPRAGALTRASVRSTTKPLCCSLGKFRTTSAQGERGSGRRHGEGRGTGGQEQPALGNARVATGY